jgi:hypothetical protein
MEKTPEGTRYHFTTEGTGKIKVHFQPQLAVGSKIQSIDLNGVEADFQTKQNAAGTQPHLSFALKKKATILIRHKRGIGMVPLEYKPEPGDISDGLRIVSANLKADAYHITLQGPAGKAKKFRLRTGDYQIRRVRNAEIVSSDKDISTLETTFPKDAEGGYVKRQVVLELQPQ